MTPPSELRVSRWGTLVSGRGNASSLLRGRSELLEYFGVEPQPGSLNILLNWPIELRPERAKVRIEVYLDAWEAKVNGQTCLVQRWKNCPLHLLEAISPHRFDLQKGRSVVVEFDSESVLPLSPRRAMGWLGLWALRRRYAYSCDTYYHWAHNLGERHPAWFSQQCLRGAYWTPGSETEIVSFGPDEAVCGAPFNQQPDGNSAMWIRTLRDPPPGAVIEIAGTVLQTTIRGNLLTALVPAAVTAASGDIEVRLLGPDGASCSNAVTLRILSRPAGAPR